MKRLFLLALLLPTVAFAAPQKAAPPRAAPPATVTLKSGQRVSAAQIEAALNQYEQMVQSLRQQIAVLQARVDTLLDLLTEKRAAPTPVAKP